MKYAVRFHFHSAFENGRPAYKQRWRRCNGIEWSAVIVGIYFTWLDAVYRRDLHAAADRDTVNEVPRWYSISQVREHLKTTSCDIYSHLLSTSES